MQSRLNCKYRIKKIWKQITTDTLMIEQQNINQLPKDWKWVKLDEISDKISLNKIKIKQKDYLEEGTFPVVDQGQDLIAVIIMMKN